ncbi:MAG: FtsW/RodA/SpoVE family cell cycle protein, partial [Vulcanimicrobiaceae bacterium]
MAGAIAVAALALRLAPAHALGPLWLTLLLAVLAIGWILRQPRAGRRDDALPALAIAVSAVGLVVVARLSLPLGRLQEIWLAVSLGLTIAATPFFDRIRRVAAYKYLWVLASLVLFLLLALFGEEVNGARLWIRIGSVHYEPIELIKLFIVFFMAAYLAETADVIAAAKPWSLRANAKYLGPLIIGWGSSLLILVFEHDLGMAILLFAIFASMLYVATRRT